MRGRRQVAGALVAGLVAGVLVLAVPAPVAADGGTDVEVTCSGIPLLGTTTTTATVNADDDVDPVEVGGTVINTLNVPVPVGDVPVEVTVTELKLTVPIPAGVTLTDVAFTPSSFSGDSWSVVGTDLVATLTGSVPLGGGAPAPTVPDVAVTTTIAGPARTVSWTVPSSITAKASSFLGPFTATCTPTTPSTVLITTEVTEVAGPEVPGVPAGLDVDLAQGYALVRWSAPASDGGAAIESYLVTSTAGGVPGPSLLVGADGREAEFTDLEDGVAHTFSVAATNAVGTGLAVGPSATVTPRWWLPWSSGATAVDEIVTWMTGTPPTAAERSGWLARLDAGTLTVGGLVDEVRDGADALANVDPTIRLYSAYLVRVPDAGGLNFWLRRRRSGYTLSRISSYFEDSSEFQTRYGSLTNRQFVEQIYRNVLGREGEESGIAYWTRQLDLRRKDRGQVMINFSESSEYIRVVADQVDAAAVLIHLIGISPSTAQRDAFVDAADASSLADAVRPLLREASFADRAG
ncbi:MAG: DUF4214 domain-containing protein [Acidimicrobiales bacterium]|nr:DUF4214 domain-containing protein [Acidimicrobiales bacterium]